jgi:hypothetical protein
VTDRLFAIRDRLDRADEQLEVVKELARGYFNSDRCRYSGEYNPKANETTIVRNIEMPDVRLATLVGEVVHDLRSSLDHLAYELVVENGGVPNENTFWPILKIAPTPNKKGVRPPPHVSGGVSATASALIERWQPYWVGFYPEHHPLWILHRMSIIDKHRHIPIHGIAASVNFGGGAPFPPFKWNSTLVKASEYEAELRLRPEDPTVDVEGQVILHVVVHEPPGAEASLMTTLLLARDQIRDIVNDAADTCFSKSA